LNAFFRNHVLTIGATPNEFHLKNMLDIFGRRDASERFALFEKPLADTVENAWEIALLEQKFPGRIGIVSQNHLWDMVLELRHRILNGDIGDIFEGEFVYEQDWLNWKQGANWRVYRGESDAVCDGGIGKLNDILIHAISTLRFVTGMKIKAVETAKVHEIITERGDGGGTFAKAEQGTVQGVVKVGGSTAFHGDDAMEAIVTLENGARIRVRIAQSVPGEKNSFHFRLSGRKGDEGKSVSFDTDNADVLTTSDLSNRRVIEVRDPGVLAYVDDVADWIREGLCMNNPPVRFFTPPRHGQGWREIHRRQLMAFALYCQRVWHGLQDVDTRKDLFFVPTALESFYDLKAIKAMYEAAASGKRTEIEYPLAA